MKQLILFSIILSTMSCNKITFRDLTHKSHYNTQSKQFVISIIGDSMSSDDLNNTSMNGITSSKSYGWYLRQLLDTNIYSFRNWAISGVGIDQMWQQAHNIVNEKDSTKNNICIILGCINNITFNSMTGAQCYQQMKSIHDYLKQNGYKTIAIALTSRRQLSYFTEDQSKYFWSHIIVADSLFNQNQKLYTDYYLNLQQKDGFSGYEAATQSDYFLDGCHWSNTGKEKIATLLKTIITTLN